MLGKKTTEHLNAKISSVIGADMVMEGNITSKETIRIEGTVKGDVSSEGILIVSAPGKIIGNVKGSSIMVSGTIEGDMDSNGRIEVSATGRINGNIRTKSLIIDENAVFQGQCTMNTQETVMKAASFKTEAGKEDTAEKK
jgi:cytoskeletal protein CcmA (bactofilin family)